MWMFVVYYCNWKCFYPDYLLGIAVIILIEDTVTSRLECLLLLLGY